LKEIDMPGFVGRNNKDLRWPEMLACAKALKASYTKVGAIGYCYGGWGCFRLAAKGNNLLDCMTVAHPSIFDKSEIDALGVPTQIIAPERDPQLTPEMKVYCNTVIPTLGIPYRYDYYPGLTHGFAAKGDAKDQVQREGLERAKRAAVGWFNEFLH
jgi:dienelactone hydrolase